MVILSKHVVFGYCFHRQFSRSFSTSTKLRRALNSYRNGPDQILPATSFKTSEPDGAVELYRTSTGAASTPPISVYSMFKNVHQRFPKTVAMIIERNGQKHEWNYDQYFEESKLVAKALIKLGLERFHGVCLMGFNSPEWFIANYGAIFSGGLVAGVYATNSAAACRDIANNCRAQIILVDDDTNLQKFLSIKKDVPYIKTIVQWLGVPEEPGVLSWSEFLEIGRNEANEQLDERLSMAAINQCCSLIYTSGTTGPAKGVMLSQDHITWSSKQYSVIFDPVVGDSLGLSYLPLSHITAYIGDMNCTLFNGLTIYFAKPDALQGSLGATLVEVQPHGFIGVPRVWEKYYEKLQEVAAKNGKIATVIASWAKRHGLNYNKAMLEERKLSIFERINYTLAKTLIINKVKKALGLNRVYFLATGTAPIDLAILEYFMSLDLPIQEAYGMSESLSFCSFNLAKPNQYRLGSVGKILDQTEVKLKPTAGTSKGVGEILMKGRNIMMGYLRLPDKTDETVSTPNINQNKLDGDQWLHTGDLGQFDTDGYLYITGRIKELIITAGGENIPPVYIEESIKKELPCLSGAMVIGDRRKFLTILLTLKAESNLKTSEPLQDLTPSCRVWMKSEGVTVTTVAEAIKDVLDNPRGPLANSIDQGIQRYNLQHAISNAQRVQRWTILPHDFSQPTGELNSTLKLKRDAVVQKYSQIINQMYKDK